MTDNIYVPEVNRNYVPFGAFRELVTVFKSKRFFPIYISGLSGNGKTDAILQAAAKTGREVVRLNVSADTDEAQLIGTWRLMNGDMIFQEGLVITAMRRGAVLLLDEIDRAKNQIICLNGILEGKQFVIKHTGEIVVPKEGFTIVATANTKGMGSDDGRFVAANVLDSAFMERFEYFIEQDFPKASIEKKIITKYAESQNVHDLPVDAMVLWAASIRKLYADGAIDELVSTRRMLSIIDAYAAFGDLSKAMLGSMSRFDAEVRDTFVDLFQKIQGTTEVVEDEDE